MDELETRAVFPCELEIRQSGRRLFGTFPYSSGPGRGMGTVSDRGRVRKERVGPNAFSWQLERFEELQQELSSVIDATVDRARVELLQQELERRNVHILTGHSFDNSLGDMLRGSARVRSTQSAVEFEVDLPVEAEQPSYMLDAVKKVRGKLYGGISPGFRVPPASVVPDAETFEPEPGNPGVQVRVIKQAVLYELSLVTRPVYSGTEVDVRAFEHEGMPGRDVHAKRKAMIWLT